MFRLNRSQIVAVSIETAFQNGSIAFILLQLTLDDPKNDIATIAPIAQIMLTGECFIIAYGHTMLFNSYKMALRVSNQQCLYHQL